MLLRRPRQVDPVARLLALPAYQEIPVTLVQHCQAAPLGVLVRGTMEWLLDEPALEQVFRDHAASHYTRELTLATLVRLLIQVSAGLRASVFAAYRADQALDDPTITTSFQALYGKLGRFDPAASSALVRHSATKLTPLLHGLRSVAPSLPGYRLRVLDGNVLAGTDHRLKALRPWLNACLPGKSLVVYEPGLGLVTDLVLCEDAYTQERALLVDLLPRVQTGDLWVADRNFCTARFVCGVMQRDGCVLVRQHRRNLPYTPLGRLRKRGRTATGTVYEQPVYVTDPESEKLLPLRRIEVRLFDKTRDGERTIGLLTNLPATITAEQIADIYRERWTIEKQFQFLTQSLHCEVKGLGKPRAALFMFAMALVASNALAVVRATLRQAHGVEEEAEVSGYYLADEVAADYRTLMKYLPTDQWRGWRQLSPSNLQRLLTSIAKKVNLRALKRSPRGPKKPPSEKPIYDRKHKHYSTFRLIEGAEKRC
jgi:hypothetical protein